MISSYSKIKFLSGAAPMDHYAALGWDEQSFHIIIVVPI